MDMSAGFPWPQLHFTDIVASYSELRRHDISRGFTFLLLFENK